MYSKCGYLGLEGRIWEARGDDSIGLVREDLGAGSGKVEDFWYSPPRVLGREGMEKFSLVDGGCKEVDVDFWWSYGLMKYEEATRGG